MFWTIFGAVIAAVWCCCSLGILVVTVTNQEVREQFWTDKDLNWVIGVLLTLSGPLSAAVMLSIHFERSDQLWQQFGKNKSAR